VHGFLGRTVCVCAKSGPGGGASGLFLYLVQVKLKDISLISEMAYTDDGGYMSIDDTKGKQFLDGFLMAHANPEGTAHDWQAPGHGGLPVPGGFVNPHGHGGTNTWPDGRAKYSPEDLKLMEAMGY